MAGSAAIPESTTPQRASSGRAHSRGIEPLATWLDFWREVARRASLRVRFQGQGAGQQPAWARPALLAIAADSAWSYAWRAARPVNVEIYYAAVVRSMTAGLSNFFFGAQQHTGKIVIAT